MTSIKKILFAGLLLLIAPFITKANVSPTKEFYVNDYANVLTNETKNNIIELNKKLYEKTGAQLVVVTLNSLDGDSVENVANTIFNDFEIGSKNDNGILILFAKEDRKIRVEVGYGLEETLNDGKVGRMIDEYMIPYLRNDHFDEGIANGFNAFFNYLLNYYGISDIDLQSVSTDETSDEPTTAEIILIIIFIIIIIYVSIKNDFGGGYYGGGFYGGGHSGGHFSGGGSFGGGGHSGGGGASRGF